MAYEMGLSLAALQRVITLRSSYPSAVFCLKGNHDNMTNAADHGDYPFYKYADEGAMGALWLRFNYGDQLARKVREYELTLPLVATNGIFCASHAEPAIALPKELIIAYREHAEVVEALIWTANDEAVEGSVQKTLASLLGSNAKAQHASWFAGHRPVGGHFALRAGGNSSRSIILIMASRRAGFSRNNCSFLCDQDRP